MGSLIDALLSPSVIATAIPSIIGAIGGGISASQSNDYNKEALQYKQSQDAIDNAYRDKALAQQLLIAQMGRGSANAGAGATIAAARITDARERMRIKQEATQALLAARLRSLEMVKPEVINAAGMNAADSYDKNASRTQQGFQGLAQLLQQPFSQIGRPTFGG